MGMGDTGNAATCHARKLYVQCSKMNENFTPVKIRFSAVVLAAGLFCASLSATFAAGTIVRDTASDPILNGPAHDDSTCFLPGQDADVVAGVDVHGNPVVLADTAGAPFAVSTGSETVVPEVLVHHSNLYRVRAPIAVKGLADAVSPPPACPYRAQR